jgi:hypothetical protein
LVCLAADANVGFVAPKVLVVAAQGPPRATLGCPNLKLPEAAAVDFAPAALDFAPVVCCLLD